MNLDENVKWLVDSLHNFPKQLEKNLAIDPRCKKQGISNILFTGMGGSAIAGYLVKDIYRKHLKLPFTVIKDYFLPESINENTLVIVCSYSGNTEEAISAFKQALKHKCKIIVITSGGKLKELCNKEGIDHVIIESGVPPRFALPRLFGAALSVSVANDAIDFDLNEFKEAIKQLDTKLIEENALKLVKELNGFLPVIYNYGYNGVAMRAKAQFNENTKIPCKYEMFPEINHNDIMGWSNQKFSNSFKIIFLRTEDEPKRIAQKIDVTQKILKDKVSVLEIQMRGKNRLEKALNTILLFDFVSVYLAKEYGIAPSPVEDIELLKKEMADIPYEF